jgi:capsular polysaccharide biosynthesis protein
MDTGKCEQAEVSPSSKSSTNWGLIIGLIIGILIAVILVGLSIFLLTRKHSPSGIECPEVA